MQHFVADDGETIHLEIAGTGPPLVMLHGWTASHQEWSPVVAALGAKHRVFRWDARGHGGHRLATATRPTVARMAQDLANLLAHYALTDVVLVGHSMGALTTWEYLRAFGTGGIRNLCFIDQSPKLVTDDDWKLGIYGDFDRHPRRRVRGGASRRLRRGGAATRRTGEERAGAGDVRTKHPRLAARARDALPPRPARR